MTNFNDARDRIILGSRGDSNLLLPEEKRAVAIHESGHALVAALSPHADPVAKVTILPSGQALGVTEQLPLVEHHLYGEDYLNESLAVRLGGRAAELVVLGQGSTGAASDLASATELAIKMVREFGLSSKLGPVGYRRGDRYSSAEAAVTGCPAGRFRIHPGPHRRRGLAAGAGSPATAVTLIRTHQGDLDRLADLLVEKETVDGAEVYRLLGLAVPEHQPEGQAIAPGRAAAPAACGPACPSARRQYEQRRDARPPGRRVPGRRPLGRKAPGRTAPGRAAPGRTARAQRPTAAGPPLRLTQTRRTRRGECWRVAGRPARVTIMRSSTAPLQWWRRR